MNTKDAVELYNRHISGLDKRASGRLEKDKFALGEDNFIVEQVVGFLCVFQSLEIKMMKHTLLNNFVSS